MKNIAFNSVYIVDDDAEVCRALKWLLQSIQLQVETFQDPLDFLVAYDSLDRGCVLLDVRMPNMCGMELLESLRNRQKKMPIIMITGHGDIPMAVRAMKSGALDFIAKPFHDQSLLEKIQRALTDENKSTHVHYHMEKAIKLYARLTERERQIMSLIVEGFINKQIAEKLSIAISTVELHRARVMQKMETPNLAHLIKTALLLEI